MKKSNFENFKDSLEQIGDEANINEIVPVILIDKLVTLKNINTKIVKDLNLLEPFGEGNKTPLFACKNLRIDSIRALTEGKHLRLTLRDENNIVNAIGFFMGEKAEELTIGDKVDIVGSLEINEYNGTQSVQFKLKDVMKSL